VYILYMTPFFVSRWLLFSGFRSPHQYTLFSSTLFSLSGMFNAILFFLTRPHLIISPAVPTPPAPAVDIHTQSLKSRSSENLGSLPNRSPAYNCAPAVGANTDTRASPRRVESNLGNYASSERRYAGFRSMPVLAPVDE